MEQELNDGNLGRRRKIRCLDFCQRYLADLAGCRRPRTVDDYREVLEALTHQLRQRISAPQAISTCRHRNSWR